MKTTFKVNRLENRLIIFLIKFKCNETRIHSKNSSVPSRVHYHVFANMRSHEIRAFFDKIKSFSVEFYSRDTQKYRSSI